MADTVTPKMGMTKPEIGGSPDTWGNKLNANLDIVDAKTVRRTSQWDLLLGDDIPASGAGHFVINRYNNAGVLVDSPLNINRQTGKSYIYWAEIQYIDNVTQFRKIAPGPAVVPGYIGFYFDFNGNPVIQLPDGTTQYLGVPPGHVMFTGGVVIEVGWALCNGQQVSRAANPIVFNRYGTIYGAGNGSTTFNLPDVRGRVITGEDGGTGRLPGFTLSVAGGAATHPLALAEMPKHAHSMYFNSQDNSGDLNHRHQSDGAYEPDDPQNNRDAGGFGQIVRSRTNRTPYTNYVDLTHYHLISGATDEKGSDWAHNNIQPTIAFYPVMKMG